MVGILTPGNFEIESDGFQAKLLYRLAGLGVKLRQQRAQRMEPLAARAFTCRIADQQSQIRFQAAIDRVVKRESERCRRCGAHGDAALELARLAERRESGEKEQDQESLYKSHARLFPHLLCFGQIDVSSWSHGPKPKI